MNEIVFRALGSTLGPGQEVSMEPSVAPAPVVRIAAVACLLLLLLVPNTKAQSGNEGSIEGTVTDASGAVVPGVILKARNLSTSETTATTTNDLGIFRFLVLPAGTYEISADHPGFATLIHNGVTVTVGAKISLALTLRVATHLEKVVTVSETPLVEITRTHVSSAVDERSIDGLPVNGRNFLDFVLLSPGVIRGPVGNMVFGGQRSLSLMLLDGANNNDPNVGENFLNIPYQFSLEVVQEFQVNTNGYSAELGRAANGLVSTITKSGSNEFIGTLFWYFRDRGLNATDLISKNLGAPKEPLHVHQFGAAVGGPILKNRLFFFASYDGQRRQRQNLTLLNLPAGFALSSNPTVASFQQRALDYLTPRAVSYLQTFDEDPYFAKTDWHITPGHRLSARWNSVRFRSANTRVSGRQNSLEHTGDAPTDNHALAVSLTSTVSSRMVNVARFNYLHNDLRSGANSANPRANIFEGGQLVLTIGRAVRDPIRVPFHQFQWSDTLSWSQGRHAIKLGVDVLASRNTNFSALGFSGDYRFNSLESFGRSLAGAPNPQTGETYVQAFSGESSSGATVHPHANELAAFVQDEWRVRPGLTLSLGLRYDVQLLAKPPVRNAALLAAGWDTSFVPRDRNNLGPRLGFAWSPLRSQRLVVRGGYGLFYGWLRGGMAARTHLLNGVSVQTRTFTPGTPSGALIPAYPNTLCGPPDPSGAPPNCPPPTAGVDVIMLYSRDYVQPYDQHSSFGVEYQLHPDVAVSASYLLVRGTHLQRLRDNNLTAPVPTSIGIAGTNMVLTHQRFPATRPIAGFSRIIALEASGNSTYHGMVVQLNKRFSQNFQFQASYTLGKVVDDRPAPLILEPGGAAEASLLSDPSNPRADRGPAGEDARHRFVVSGVWELNYAKRLASPAKAIFGGWQLSGILAVQAGLPYSGLVNFDLNNDGNPFSDRTPGQPRNAFRLPTTVSLDPRVTRNVRITEGVRLQFICEAFNIFNHANSIAVRDTQFSRSTSPAQCGIAGTPCLVPQTNFGTSTATSGPRTLQLALKLQF